MEMEQAPAPAQVPEVVPQPSLSNMLGIGQDGRVGIMNEAAGMWSDFGMLGGRPVLMLGRDLDDHMFGVAQSDNSFDFWNSQGRCWYNPQGGLLPNGWPVVQFLWGSDGTQWIVGTEGGVCKAPPSVPEGWEDCGYLGGWPLKCLAFDSAGTMWGVGTAGNLGRWTGTEWGDWTSVFGGWNFAFWGAGPDGLFYGLSTDGNAGYFNGTSWVDLGLIGGWQMRWLYWPDPAHIFGTG